MSFYSDGLTFTWEYIPPAIIGLIVVWLCIRATRKSERRRTFTIMRREDVEQNATRPTTTRGDVS